MNATVLGPAFLLSGMAGLIYQVVWVRQFGNVFGNTVQSAAVVTAVFMAGLGLGSAWGGRWVDRHPDRAVQGYAWAEFCVALLGGAMALVLPRLMEASASLSRYTLNGDTGWNSPSASTRLATLVAAVVLMLPSTLLMGATLPLLVRVATRGNVALAADGVGLLYGLNTAGAALGALCTDLAFIPAWGVARTQAVAVALNLAAAAVAAAWGRARSGEDAHPAEDVPPEPGRRVFPFMAAALLCSGAGAMALEVTWLRAASTALGGYRSTYSALVAVMLVGIWLGAWVASALHRRLKDGMGLWIGAQAALVITTLGLLTLVHPRALVTEEARVLGQLARGGDPAVAAVVHAWLIMEPLLLMAGLPAVLMGMAYPLANAVTQDHARRIGRRAGDLYLANTAGNVMGSVLGGLVLLPDVGLQHAVGAAALLSLISVPVAMAGETRAQGHGRRGGWVAMVLAAAVVAAWFARPSRALLETLLDQPLEGSSRVLHVGEGLHETVMVMQNDDGSRVLMTNGHSMSSNGPHAQRYMRLMAHLPMLQLPAPRDALLICFGVGNTAHALSLHPSLQRLDVADLSLNVLGAAPWFSGTHHDVLKSPAVRVFVNDGKHHLLMQPPASYDFITLEPPPIALAGVSSLYSRDFYALARSRLRPGGYLSQWLPAYQVSPDKQRSLVRSFLDVFPGAVLVQGAPYEFILVGAVDGPVRFSAAELARQLGERPRVQADLAGVHLGSPASLLASVVASGERLERVTRGSPPVTDDDPRLEYGLLTGLRTMAMDPGVFDAAGVEHTCADCTTQPDLVPDLVATRSVLARRLALSRFQRMAVAGDEDAPRVFMRLDPAERHAWESSVVLQELVEPWEAAMARAAALAREGQGERAAHLLAALREDVPDTTGAR